jgi:hypothetical protein
LPVPTLAVFSATDPPWVRKAPSVRGAIPRWLGTRLPLSGELSAASHAAARLSAAGGPNARARFFGIAHRLRSPYAACIRARRLTPTEYR